MELAILGTAGMSDPKKGIFPHGPLLGYARFFDPRFGLHRGNCPGWRSRQRDKESEEVAGKLRFCEKAVECETDESARHRGDDNIDQESKKCGARNLLLPVWIMH